MIHRLDPDAVDKVNEFARYAELMPGVVVIHEVGEFPVVWMSDRGLNALGTTLDELKEMGTQYYDRFFNIEDMADFIPKMHHLLTSRDPLETFTYFQQVKFAGCKEWIWHICATRIFYFNQQGEPILTVTTALPIDKMEHITHKAERLLQENQFIKQHVQRFGTLGKREQQVLRMVALGNSSTEIATTLFISVDTVNTHRKNIKQKLGIGNMYEFSEYARAFNLI